MLFSSNFIFAGLLTLAWANPGNDVVFSSKDYDDIFYPIWSTWHKAEDSWILVLPGNRRTNQGLSVHRWLAGEKPTQLYSTGAREGIYQVRSSALSPSGDQLLIRSFSNPILFEFRLDKKARIKRAYELELADTFLFWDAQRLVSGTKYPKLRFTTQGEDRNPIPQLKKLKAQLPKKINHPVEPYYAKNLMHMSKHGEQLAIAFGLSEEVTVWDGHKRHRYAIGFPGYITPPWKRPKDLDRLKEWFQEFHHLQTLTWFQGELYAMFQHGYDDLGVWVKFEDKGTRKIWDNGREKIRIFAMEKDGLILGEKILDTEEEVKWRLWQASSLPSP